MQRQQQQQQRQGQEQRHTKDQEDQLVPIRLDIEHGAHHLRDSFTWNLNGRSFL